MMKPLTETSTFADLSLFLEGKGMTLTSMRATPEGFVAFVKSRNGDVSFSGTAATMTEAINLAIARTEVS